MEMHAAVLAKFAIVDNVVIVMIVKPVKMVHVSQFQVVRFVVMEKAANQTRCVIKANVGNVTDVSKVDLTPLGTGLALKNVMKPRVSIVPPW